MKIGVFFPSVLIYSSGLYGHGQYIFQTTNVMVLSTRIQIFQRKKSAPIPTYFEWDFRALFNLSNWVCQCVVFSAILYCFYVNNSFKILRKNGSIRTTLESLGILMTLSCLPPPQTRCRKCSTSVKCLQQSKTSNLEQIQTRQNAKQNVLPFWRKIESLIIINYVEIISLGEKWKAPGKQCVKFNTWYED